MQPAVYAEGPLSVDKCRLKRAIYSQKLAGFRPATALVYQK